VWWAGTENKWCGRGRHIDGEKEIQAEIREREREGE